MLVKQRKARQYKLEQSTEKSGDCMLHATRGDALFTLMAESLTAYSMVLSSHACLQPVLVLIMLMCEHYMVMKNRRRCTICAALEGNLWVTFSTDAGLVSLGLGKLDILLKVRTAFPSFSQLRLSFGASISGSIDGRGPDCCSESL